jgi:hypothetical protein
LAHSRAAYLRLHLAAVTCSSFHHHVIQISRGRVIASYFGPPVRYCGEPKFPDPSNGNFASVPSGLGYLR